MVYFIYNFGSGAGGLLGVPLTRVGRTSKASTFRNFDGSQLQFLPLPTLGPHALGPPLPLFQNLDEALPLHSLTTGVNSNDCFRACVRRIPRAS